MPVPVVVLPFGVAGVASPPPDCVVVFDSEGAFASGGLGAAVSVGVLPPDALVGFDCDGGASGSVFGAEAHAPSRNVAQKKGTSVFVLMIDESPRLTCLLLRTRRA